MPRDIARLSCLNFQDLLMKMCRAAPGIPEVRRYFQRSGSVFYGRISGYRPHPGGNIVFLTGEDAGKDGSDQAPLGFTFRCRRPQTVHLSFPLG